jgi:hypothetical protein
MPTADDVFAIDMRVGTILGASTLVERPVANGTRIG